METKKKITKLTLAEIPKVGSPFRTSLLKKLTESDIYKEAILKKAALGFSTEELNAIEEKYKNQKGLFNEDIQNEINKKVWLLKPTTIKQYIQRDQLPMPKERRKIKGGAASLYPLDFMRHLNFVRFMLNAGREICENILNAFTTPPDSHRISDYSFSQSMHYGKEIYDGDDSFEPFLYDSHGDMFANLSFIDALINDGLDRYIKMFKIAEAVINNDKSFKRDQEDNNEDQGFFNSNEFEQNSFNTMKSTFNSLKAKLESSKNLDDEFYNNVRIRMQKYLKQLQEIRHTMKDISRKFDLLIEEMKNASWI